LVYPDSPPLLLVLRFLSPPLSPFFLFIFTVRQSHPLFFWIFFHRLPFFPFPSPLYNPPGTLFFWLIRFESLFETFSSFLFDVFFFLSPPRTFQDPFSQSLRFLSDSPSIFDLYPSQIVSPRGVFFGAPPFFPPILLLSFGTLFFFLGSLPTLFLINFPPPKVFTLVSAADAVECLSRRQVTEYQSPPPSFSPD